MTRTIKAVLFDLDGTLLDNDLDVFLPRYLEAIAARVAHVVPPKQFIQCLLAGTKAMTANDGRGTNEQVFAEVFYPLIGHSREELEPIFLDFYQQNYPALGQYTQRKPEARQVMQAAFDLGYDVAISTNPLFPMVAMEERLRWAGVDGFPYRLVTSYENCHASKPGLRYYQEVLEMMGCPGAQALVVGNEAHDLLPAQLGCKTYLVPSPQTRLDPAMPPPDYQGDLAGVEVVLRKLAQNSQNKQD
jgi:FMN phosphatase YigB (HAD superfamily)